MATQTISEDSGSSLYVNSHATEPMGTVQLDAYARELALRLEVFKNAPDRSANWKSNFQRDVEVIERAYQLSVTWASKNEAHSPVADWLLDNFYVVREQIHDIRVHLPRSFFRELPKLADGKARVHVIARELASHCDCALDEELIARFVDQFQLNSELTIGETWAIPVMLRLALIENLRDICSQLIQELQSAQDVEQIIKRWESEARFDFQDGTSLRCAPTLIALHNVLRERRPESDESIAALDRHIQRLGWDYSELRRLEQRRVAANQVSMGNIITSMRLIGALDWVRFFEETNRCERVLRRDPMEVYEQMDFASRNRYRNAVEDISKHSGLPETQVAEHALAFAEKELHHSPTNDNQPAELQELKSHIGYWLVDDGRRDVEKLVRYRSKLSDGWGPFMKRHASLVYFGGLALFTLLFLSLFYLAQIAIGISVPYAAGMSLLALLPASEMAQQLLNTILTHRLPVNLIPKLEFRDGVSQKHPTFIVVPSMLTGIREAKSLLNKLENHYLTNPDPAFRFALLTDFADSHQQHMSADDEIVEFAVQGIRALNARYGTSDSSPFYLFHRERRWNPCEGKWMGWERKRGKLMEFGKLLAGHTDSSYVVQEGDLSCLDAFRSEENHPFIITLDADTVLPRAAGRRLVGALAHPLNRAIIVSKKTGDCVMRGYSILQPRVSIHNSDAAKTRFLQVHAASPGIDPYASAASDVYQDLFGEGSFTGKGIYDLRAFEQMLDQAFPENRILSHDLIEGCHARVALVSDIEVFDGYPSRYDADAKRMHRWARGDWQILPWLFRKVKCENGLRPNRLSLLSKWKIADNLRRTLVPIFALLVLVIGWILLPSQSLFWTVALAFFFFFPVLLRIATGLMNWSNKFDFTDQLRVYLHSVMKTAEYAFYSAAFLPHKAVQMADAIGRTLYRLTIGKSNLLQWETAAATESRLGKSKWSLIRELSICSAVAVVMLLVIPRTGKLGAMPWLSIWLAAPIVGQLISTPRKRASQTLNSDDESWLRQVASGTWAYFERYVNAESNWLPPDNVQEYPREKIAYRISPTNEGLFLISGLVARTYGFVGIDRLVELWEKNLASWNSLEQLHGHHFNWYETTELKPLAPFYVSTVDSGNLMACYLTLGDSIRDLMQQPIISQRQIAGLSASLRWLSQTIEQQSNKTNAENRVGAKSNELLTELKNVLDECQVPSVVTKKSFSEMRSVVDTISRIVEKLEVWLNKFGRAVDATTIVAQVKIVQVRYMGILDDVNTFMPWLDTLAAWETEKASGNTDYANLLEIVTPDLSLQQLASLPTVLQSRRAQAQLSNSAGPEKHDYHVQQLLDNKTSSRDKVSDLPRLLTMVEDSAAAATSMIHRLQAIREQCESAAMKMNFRFLYSKRQKLFSIGYNATIGRLDTGHYDLLCSECRIASYLAIAKGDVDTEHWFRLGRQSTEINGKYTLLSWGGTMFEFLMPQLFQKSFEGSLIETTCQTAIERQIQYGRQRQVPWGISESAYSAIASNSDYQYKSFGVPGLGLKRGLSKDLVISPYSSALAVPFAPHAATENLRKLSAIAMGSWGFYDAVDYTATRLQRNQTANVVRNYMAHHQGMTLLALANASENNIVCRWFHAHPLVRANELLLQEKTPTLIDSEVPNADEVEPAITVREESTFVSRQIVGIHARSPKVLLLSNGEFSSMISHTGGGYCRYKDTQVTRWRSDSTRDNWGNFLYLCDRETGLVWSATYQPTRVAPDHYEALFSVDKGEIHRRQGDIETTLEVVVSPEHNAEVRQLRILNLGTKRRTIEITSFAEVALAPQAADVAHPAFQKLFVETEYIAEDTTLIARRRPRAATQEPLYAVHTLAVPTAFSESVDYDSSRETFVGRCRTAEMPQAMLNNDLAKTTGAVLDPAFSLRCVVTIEPSESVTLGFTTAFATTREQALATADLFHDLRGVQRAIELAWAYTQVEMRHLNITAKLVQLYQQLGGLILYPDNAVRAESSRIAANRLGQSSLWHFGISGDNPILLLRITDTTEIDLAKQVVDAHSFLISRGLKFDLVLINDYPGTYFDSLQEQLQTLLDDHHQDKMASERRYLLRGSQMSAEDHTLLDTVAVVLLRGKRGSLSQQIEAALLKSRNDVTRSTPKPPRSAIRFRTQAAKKQLISRLPEDAMSGEFANGYGQFTDQGRRYEMRPTIQQPTPAPWSNVIANEQFGTLLTESGGGYTWFQNSRENKLTIWSNDPVSDIPSEIIYVRDTHSGMTWSPIQALGIDVPRRVTHGQGFTTYSTGYGDIQSETLVTVHPNKPLKFVRVRLHNQGDRVHRLQVTYYAETVLGVNRSETVLHQVSNVSLDHQALLMSNGYHPEYKRQTMFLRMLGGTEFYYTGDRTSFLGRDGSHNEPAGLVASLNQRVGGGLDPCLAVQGSLLIEPGCTEEILFVLGAALDRGALTQLLEESSASESINKSMNEFIEAWNKTLSCLTIQTPNRALDVMVNRWLPYQVLSCRVWGRSAFYQSGGAYGFRDQLQDVMALVYSRPDIAREHILRAAARQFIEGDVQHWWHPPSGKGTRTRFSDDFLFLPYVTLYYVQCTGDRTILDEVVPFISSPQLTQHEQERYEQPTVSDTSASLLEHCVRAMNHGQKYGQHGLPLMGCGDWNDGMNKVGEEGTGESVWVAWFQIVVFEGFAKLFQELGNEENAAKYTAIAQRLRANVDEHAWDGQWYRRAFFDDGSPLGSADNEECQIDSLGQSWAVIANGATDRSKMGFESAVQQLVDRATAMILLFTPPFDKAASDPGYIKGYLPGVRENGGQYSHAAMWMIQAATILGQGDLAMELFDLINPILHSDSPNKAMLYKVEPYVIAADVYSNPQHEGRGGWTWYTGSASWMYRVAIENLLGIQIEKDRLRVRPALPPSWERFQFTYRRNQTTWHVEVIRMSEGTEGQDDFVELVEDGQEHQITLRFA
jgi:cyclic beta-1,2-glucan synthetase